MKFSKEARIGLLVGISILIFFAGFYFLKGSNLFSSANEYFALYDEVGGLQPSAAVQIRGLQVGKVSAIHLEGNKVRVTLEIPKKTRLPKGTVANLTSLDLLGGKGLQLELGASSVLAEDGEQIAGVTQTGLVDKISSEINPLLQDVRGVVLQVDSVLSSVNNILNPNTQAALQRAIADLQVAVGHFSNVATSLDKESAALAGTIRNANSITTNIAKNNENIDQMLADARATMSNLKNAPIEDAVKKIQSVGEQLDGILKKINNNEGTLGSLVNDKKMYGELNKALEQFSEVAADLKKRPWRYINLSVFPKKDSKLEKALKESAN